MYRVKVKQMTKYLSAVETAKVVRKILKAKFPGVKFSVRSETYSMGNSVDISWTDGPTSEEVDSTVGVLAGHGFDGMIDLSYSITQWMLPDGSFVLANSQGSGNSGGMDAPIHKPKPHPDAVEVQFADHIMAHRMYSVGFLKLVADYVNKKYGGNVTVSDGYSKGLDTKDFDIARIAFRVQQHSKLVAGVLVCDDYLYGNVE